MTLRDISEVGHSLLFAAIRPLTHITPHDAMFCAYDGAAAWA